MSNEETPNEPDEKHEDWESEYEEYISDQIANMGTKWDF